MVNGSKKGRETGIKYHFVFQLAELNGGVFFNRQFVGSARKSGLNYAITLALLKIILTCSSSRESETVAKF